MRCALLVVLLAMVPGCSDVPKARWHTTPPLPKKNKEFLDALVEIVTKRGYQVEARDDVRGTLVTQWKVRLGASWREGKRERVDAHIEPTPQGSALRLMVSREINDETRKPLSEPHADWIAWGGDEDLAAAMVMLVKMKLEKRGLDD